MKTQMSRFQIHDDLTAPEASLPVLKGALAGGRPAAELPRRAGGLARPRCAPTRASASELRHGTLPLADARAHRARGRRALRLRARPRAARAHRRARPGLGLDEIALAREWDSRDEREAALLRYLRAARSSTAAARRCHLHEEAREAGWSDEQLLEAIAVRRARGLHGDGQRRRRGAGRRLGRGRRACCAPPRADGPGATAAGSPIATLDDVPGTAAPTSTRRSSWSASAGRARSSTCCSRAARMRFSEIAQRRPATLRPPAVRAHEGARGARHRRAPRPRGLARARRVRADRDGPRARARAGASCARGRDAGWTDFGPPGPTDDRHRAVH